METAFRALIPIRSFDGMTRLSGRLGSEDRRRLARELAGRTIRAALDANTQVSVITADAEVDRWALTLGVECIAESTPHGLDAAAAAGVAEAGDYPWLVIHADLPAINADDVRAAVRSIGKGWVLAPSHDGGTSLIGGTGRGFPFRYGPGSFRRHLAAVRGDATTLIRPGLALDLDRPWDLNALQQLGHLDS
jgi:2-phospho-L-lactate guanylyltransferase